MELYQFSIKQLKSNLFKKFGNELDFFPSVKFNFVYYSTTNPCQCSGVAYNSNDVKTNAM